MILESSRKHSFYTMIKIFVCVGVIMFVCFRFMGGEVMNSLFGAIAASSISFFLVVLIILPLDITADEKNICVSTYFKKYVVPYESIQRVEFYIASGPVIRITQLDGKRIEHGLGGRTNKKIDLLMDILNAHQVKIYETDLDQ